MPSFTFTGPEPRDFHDFGHLEPGASVEATENPDPVWFSEAKPAKASKSESE